MSTPVRLRFVSLDLRRDGVWKKFTANALLFHTSLFANACEQSILNYKKKHQSLFRAIMVK